MILHKKFISKALQIAIAAGILAFLGLMLTKVLPYLSFRPGINFLTTKSDATNYNPVFRAGFYVHITSSCWVMLSGLLQFFPALFRHNRAWHQRLGKLYVVSILALAAPSGLVLAAFANGGLVAKVGFTLQCLVWWLATWQAYQMARQRQWQLHTKWMLRSYAVTLAAMSLRLESYLLYYYCGTKPIEAYLTVTWLSWTGNLLLIEVLIQQGLGRRFVQAFLSKSTTHELPLSAARR